MTEAEKRMREIYAQELDRDGEGMAAFLWRESEPAHPDSSNGRIIRAMLAAEAAAIERERERVEKAIRDHCDQHGPSGGAWNVSMILECTQRTLKEGASHVG